MPLFELNVAVATKAGNNRVTEGDIVSIQDPGKDIGRKVLDGWLVVPINVPFGWTKHMLRDKFCVELFEGGLVRDVDFRDIIHGRQNNDMPFEIQSLYSQDNFVWDIHNEEPIPRPAYLEKFRYRISFSTIILEQLDFDHLRNKTSIYQPFLSESRIINMKYLTSSKGHYFVEHKNGKAFIKKTKQDKRSKSKAVPVGQSAQIRTITSMIGSDQEYHFYWASGVDLIKDKYDNSWVYPNGLK